MAGSVSDFYAGRKVLVTGATGFIGKVLVHKLLTACPDIDLIYLLIRTKRGVPVDTRLQDFLNVTIFDSVPKHCLKKVVALPGDIALPNLGLSPEHEELLANQVSVIFHSAATVKFDEPLTESLLINVEGTQRMLNLARRMTGLVALIHVSTAFSHCYRPHIGEEHYPSFADPIRLMQFCQRYPELVNKVDTTRAVIHPHPNTYTFAKCLAEQLLMEQGPGLPIAVIRPTIVTASWSDPLPGWIDNLNTLTGIIAAGSTGLLRAGLMVRQNHADLIPVDIVVNLMCVVPWKMHQSAQTAARPIEFYNCAGNADEGVTWGDIENILYPLVKQYPMEKVVWFPGGSFYSVKMFYYLALFFLMYLPAVFMDQLIKLSGRKAVLVTMVGRIAKGQKVLEYFSRGQWRWDTYKMHHLHRQLDSASAATFPIDFGTMDWRQYFKDYVLGTRHFVLKCSPTSIEKCRIRLRFFYAAHVTLQFVIAFSLVQSFLLFFTINAVLIKAMSITAALAFAFGQTAL